MRALARLLLFSVLGLTARAESLLIAVGEDGRRVCSRDGMQWEYEYLSLPEAGPLRGLVYGLNRFLAVGGLHDGRLLSTPDGRNWRELPSVLFPLETVAFGRNRFVAVGGTRPASSVDGERFVAGTAPTLADATCMEVAGGDTEAGYCSVAVGTHRENDTLEGWRGTTTDGATWNMAFQAQAPLNYSVAYGAGHFVIVSAEGSLETAHDGVTWVRQKVAERRFYWVLWNGDRFYAKGASRSWTSQDAITWTPLPEDLPLGRPTLSRSGLWIDLAADGRIFFSSDLKRWRGSNLPEGPRFHAAAEAPAPPASP